MPPNDPPKFAEFWNLTMKKPVYSAAALLFACVMTFGSCLTASAQPSGADKKVASIQSRVAARRSMAPQVYLLRGLLNVFSLGMDGLANELGSVGISATVANHASWQSIAGDIAAAYRSGQHGPIVLVGHSLGADAVMSMGEYLGQQGIPVALIVPFDGTGPHAATANVSRVLNLYKNTSATISRGPGFRGELTNYYVADPGVTHMNIDKDPKLHAMVIARIRAIVRGGSRSASAHSDASEKSANGAVKPLSGPTG
jgi:pimeloyl-ACP methyl ester carboxylesterase